MRKHRFVWERGLFWMPLCSGDGDGDGDGDGQGVGDTGYGGIGTGGTGAANTGGPSSGGTEGESGFFGGQTSGYEGFSGYGGPGDQAGGQEGGQQGGGPGTGGTGQDSGFFGGQESGYEGFSGTGGPAAGIGPEGSPAAYGGFGDPTAGSYAAEGPSTTGGPAEGPTGGAPSSLADMAFAAPSVADFMAEARGVDPTAMGMQYGQNLGYGQGYQGYQGGPGQALGAPGLNAGPFGAFTGSPYSLSAEAYEAQGRGEQGRGVAEAGRGQVGPETNLASQLGFESITANPLGISPGVAGAPEGTPDDPVGDLGTLGARGGLANQLGFESITSSPLGAPDETTGRAHSPDNPLAVDPMATPQLSPSPLEAPEFDARSLQEMWDFTINPARSPNPVPEEYTPSFLGPFAQGRTGTPDPSARDAPTYGIFGPSRGAYDQLSEQMALDAALAAQGHRGFADPFGAIPGWVGPAMASPTVTGVPGPAANALGGKGTFGGWQGGAGRGSLGGPGFANQGWQGFTDQFDPGAMPGRAEPTQGQLGPAWNTQSLFSPSPLAGRDVEAEAREEAEIQGRFGPQEMRGPEITQHVNPMTFGLSHIANPGIYEAKGVVDPETRSHVNPLEQIGLFGVPGYVADKGHTDMFGNPVEGPDRGSIFGPPTTAYEDYGTLGGRSAQQHANPMTFGLSHVANPADIGRGFENLGLNPFDVGKADRENPVSMFENPDPGRAGRNTFDPAPSPFGRGSPQSFNPEGRDPYAAPAPTQVTVTGRPSAAPAPSRGGGGRGTGRGTGRGGGPGPGISGPGRGGGPPGYNPYENRGPGGPNAPGGITSLPGLWGITEQQFAALPSAVQAELMGIAQQQQQAPPAPSLFSMMG